MSGFRRGSEFLQRLVRPSTERLGSIRKEMDLGRACNLCLINFFRDEKKRLRRYGKNFFPFNVEGMGPSQEEIDQYIKTAIENSRFQAAGVEYIPELNRGFIVVAVLALAYHRYNLAIFDHLYDPNRDQGQNPRDPKSKPQYLTVQTWKRVSNWMEKNYSIIVGKTKEPVRTSSQYQAYLRISGIPGIDNLER